MENLITNHRSKSVNRLLSVQAQIQFDLESKISSFPSKSAGLRQIERNTGISKRQIMRYLAGECLPHFENLRKIYYYLYGEYNYTDLLEKVPLAIREVFISKNPINPNGKNYREDLGERISTCPAFFEIYWRTVDDSKILRDEIVTKFGEYGLTTLQDMLKEKIISEVGKGVYTSGINRSAPINAKSTQKISAQMIERFFNLEEAKKVGQNYLTFNIVKLDKDARLEMIEEICALNDKIIELEKKSDPHNDPKMVFNVFAMDKINSSEQ